MTETIDEARPAAKPKADMSRVKAYNPIEAGIALMLDKHGEVLKVAPDVSTPKALKLAKENRQEMVKFRTTVEAVRKTSKAEALAYGRLVDSEAERITAIAAPIEKAYTDAIEAQERREQARKDALTLRIEEIRATPMRMLGKEIARIEQAIEALGTLPADFQEFQAQAEQVAADALTTLQSMAEKERELQRQRDALEAQRIEQERVQAIRSKIATITELLVTAQMCRTADRVQRLVDRCKSIAPDETFQELQGEAVAEHARVLGILESIQSAKADAEKQAADLAAQREAQEARELELRQREAAAAPVVISVAPAVQPEPPAPEAIDVPVPAVVESTPLAIELIAVAHDTAPPTAEEIIEVIADHFDVAPDIARFWIIQTKF